MAYRKSNGKMSRRNNKRQPAVLDFSIRLPAGESYLDLALCASILNRRGYKQQDTTWGVAGFELFGSGTGTVSVLKLPETWVFQNAYTKAKALWNEMNDQVLDTQESIRGAYADFKVYMEANMGAQTIQDNGNQAGTILTPYFDDGAGGIKWTEGDFSAAGPPRTDWEWSQLTLPNDPTTGTTTSYYIHAVGADTTASKGIIAGYAASRSRPHTTDPNVPTINGWMNELFDDGDQLDDLKDIIEGDNNRPPYPVGSESTATDFYPGGSLEQPGLQVHSFCNFTTTTVSGKNSIMGGMFQNGMMKFVNSTGADVSVIMHLMPGSHRGYFCEEM